MRAAGRWWILLPKKKLLALDGCGLEANFVHKTQVMKAIQVGLLGIGTVGSGVFNVLTRNQEEIRRRALQT